MGLLKTKEQAGQGGGRGHSNMEHRAKTAEYKQAARKHRRSRSWLRDVIGGFIVLAALAGCATTGNADYARYADSVREQQAAEAQQFAALANMAAACNGSEVCVVSVSAMAMAAMNGGGNRGLQMAPPPRPVHWTEGVRNISQALNPALQVFGQIETQKFALEATQSDNAAQLGIVDRLAGGWQSSSTAAYDAFGIASQRATYQVTGDYVTGTQTIVGGDQIGRDQFRGDWRTGDDTRRDTIGGDRIDTDYGSGNRLSSPGPYRDVGNTGPRCTGVGCQGMPLPEPEEPEPEDG